MFKKINPDMLVTHVFSRKPLWDQKSPYHHNRTVLDKLWDEVAEEIGCPREIARSKWKCLKDQMRKEVRKEEAQQSQDSLGYRSAWRYYNQLLFIKDQLETRDLMTRERVDRSTRDPLDINSEDTGESALMEPSTSLLPTKRLKRDVQFEQKFFVEEQASSILDAAGSDKSCGSQDDDDYHFFMSLIPYMKQFDPMTKMKVRMDIQEVILKRTMGCLTNT